MARSATFFACASSGMLGTSVVSRSSVRYRPLRRTLSGRCHNAAMADDEFEPIREVRFGLVMYGGVSLAVYINGVAQELFRLVRATAPRVGDDTRLHFADADLDSTESIYRELGRRYGEPVLPAPPAAPSTASTTAPPVRTRFVVDIISGSSAGGINGIYLGKALANDQQFAS